MTMMTDEENDIAGMFSQEPNPYFNLYGVAMNSSMGFESGGGLSILATAH
jgi:hypothetical protein